MLNNILQLKILQHQNLLYCDIFFDFSMNMASLYCSNNSKRSSCLPLIYRNLSKSKKYCYKRETLLRQHDIDQRILQTADTNIPSCQSKLQNTQSKHTNHKNACCDVKHQTKLQYLPPQSGCMNDLKAIKHQIRKYIVMAIQKKPLTTNDYCEFVRLSQQSQDYLQYYLKNHFKRNDGFKQQLKHTEKMIILSMLKNNYKTLTENPPQIANRILLSFSINPLNDFHFIDWPTFSKFRKLATGTQSKSSGKLFLLNFFFVSKDNLKKSEFLAILGGIIRKLQIVMNRSNAQRLIERVQSYIDQDLKQVMKKDDLQRLMIQKPMFMWNELLDLIFML